MAIVKNNHANVGLYSTGANFTGAYTVHANSTLLVVCIMRRHNSNSSSVTYNGVAMSLGKRQNNTDGETSEIYYLKSPATGAHNIVVTPATTEEEFRVSAVDFQGEDASPLGNTGGTSGTSGAPNFTVTISNNSAIVACFISEDGSLPSAPAGYTSINATDEGVWSTGSIYRIFVGGAGSQSGTWGGGHDDFDAVAAIEILESTGPAQTTKTFTVDGIILGTQTKTFTADGIIVNRTSTSFTVDGIIASRNTSTFTIDGVVKAVQTATFTIDGQIIGGAEVSFTIDAIIARPHWATLGTIGIPKPRYIRKTFIEVSDEMKSINGRVTRDIYAGSRKEVVVLSYEIISQAEVNAIMSVIELNAAVTFTPSDDRIPLETMSVFPRLIRRKYVIPGGDYMQMTDLELLEVS